MRALRATGVCLTAAMAFAASSPASAAFGAYFASEIVKWGKVVQDAGIRPD